MPNVSLDEVINYFVNDSQYNNLNNTNNVILNDIIRKNFAFWLNMNSLLEFGEKYENLSNIEQKHATRCEYLQELDHFSEIMDLSMLTKHLSIILQNFENNNEKEANENYFYLQKSHLKNYLYYQSQKNSNDGLNNFKKISGRQKFANLGLERMSIEAKAKRMDMKFPLYDKNVASDYYCKYYPIGESQKVEAQYKVKDSCSMGIIRTNYPYIALLLTQNSSDTTIKTDLSELLKICEGFILRYGLEIGLTMFDGYIFEKNLSFHKLSLIAVQIFKPDDNTQVLQIKYVSVGGGVILVSTDSNFHKLVNVTEEKSKQEFLGQTASTHNRGILPINSKFSVSIILTPITYCQPFNDIKPDILYEKINKNHHSLMGWIVSSFHKKYSIPTSKKNLIKFNLKSKNIKTMQVPNWNIKTIRKIDNFKVVTNSLINYLDVYSNLEVNILCAHLHADRATDIHQNISIEITKAIQEELKDISKILFRVQPMIDNLHVKDVFDYRAYLTLLKENGLKPDVILTEDSMLLERVGYSILEQFLYKKNDLTNYKFIYEKNRSINVLFNDSTIVQLIDNIALGGRLACISFDLAQVYYRQNPELFEKLFREEILEHFSNSILARWYKENKQEIGYHQIMFNKIYSNDNIKKRQDLLKNVFQEICIPISDIKNNPIITKYHSAIQNYVINREKEKNKKVISLYILEGSYDAQFDRYSRVHQAASINDIHTYRITFSSDRNIINFMSVKS